MSNRRVLSPDNTNNLNVMEVANFPVVLDVEGVVGAQHPAGLKEAFEGAANIREGYFGLQREIYR